MLFLDGVDDDVMHVTSDVIIGVSCAMLLIALCVVAAIVFRSLYLARRKRFGERHMQGI